MESRELNIAYCAGVFDSEGCISVTSMPPPHRHGRFHNSIYLGMQNLRTLEFFQQTVGTGTIARRKDCYMYTASGVKAAHVIRILIPYLVTKRTTAELFLEFGRTFNGKINPTPTDIIAKRSALSDQIRLEMKRDAQAFRTNAVNSVKLSIGDNTEPSPSNGEEVDGKVYRLEGEEPTNTPSTSAAPEREEIVGAA